MPLLWPSPISVCPCGVACTQVNPFDSGDARRILEQQLGKPLREIFLDADTAFEIPVAAASLGQVRGRHVSRGARLSIF